ncbi:MAG: hypothetical protein QF724_10570 [Planctomycetota bacterium]|jgi:hypothetical protein|nr:hypothetical protein [Planctomycetota bacterium]MDP6519987.1 hypothetical protein [Planctomycetota bacterium]MDP6839370.1 hypothetical protein [Planctomycetota bacterium]
MYFNSVIRTKTVLLLMGLLISGSWAQAAPSTEDADSGYTYDKYYGPSSVGGSIHLDARTSGKLIVDSTHGTLSRPRAPSTFGKMCACSV